MNVIFKPTAVAAFALGLMSVGACGLSSEELSSRTQCIFGGREESLYTQLTARQLRSIISLEVADPALSEKGLCTATLVSPSWLITAAHCSLSENTRFTVRFEHPDCDLHDGTESLVSPVDRVVRHNDEDVMLIRLRHPVPPHLAEPLRWDEEEHIQPGDLVELAGSGLTESGTVGTLLFVVEEVESATESAIWVNGHGETGACTGDSGGPLLVRNQEGFVVLLGTLSQGEHSCLGVDRYVRTKPLVDWILATMDEQNGADDAD